MNVSRPFTPLRGEPIRRRLLLAAVLGALLLAGCPESWSPKEKAPGSAVWLSVSSAPLAASDLARLREAGVGEVFLTVARLDPAAEDGPLARVEAPDPPPSVPVTLAVSGEWPRGVDPQSLAEQVGEASGRLRFEIEDRGGVPIGLHFDLTAVDSFEAYAEFLTHLRGSLEQTFFLSVSLMRDWIEDPELVGVIEAVDFVVPFVYGQRVNEPEDGAAWDFIELEARLATLEKIGKPYLIGIVGLGTATHLSSGGGVKARTTRLSLQEILWNRDLRLRPGFSLEGVNRRVYSVVGKRATKVGRWDVRSGEGIRVVRAATSDIEELTRLVQAWDIPRCLGQLYYRLPGAEEKLSLSVENLLNALDPTPASPELELGVNLQRRTGRGWLVRFSISNRNGEITELSLLDSNYIQATALKGEFSARVGEGEFYRYELYRTVADGEPEREIRHPNLLRFHLPILEGQQHVSSGDVELKVDGEPAFEVLGRFLLPDGRTVEVGPHIWRGGKFEDAVEKE